MTSVEDKGVFERAKGCKWMDNKRAPVKAKYFVVDSSKEDMDRGYKRRHTSKRSKKK